MIRKFDSLKHTLPAQVGNITTRFFTASFEKQGFDDNGVKAWKEVKRRIPGTSAYLYPKKRDIARRSRDILIGKQSGRLRREVSNSLKSAEWENIGFKVALPYAARHNFGIKGMPKRQFMGNSRALTKKIEQKIVEELRKIHIARH